MLVLDKIIMKQHNEGEDTMSDTTTKNSLFNTGSTAMHYKKPGASGLHIISITHGC
jgi:hypothetical protein